MSSSLPRSNLPLEERKGGAIPHRPALVAATPEAQRLRLNRFYMALATYGLVIVGSALMVNIGLGTMSVLQWALYVGVAVLVNVLFYSAFRLNLNLKFSDPSLTREQIVASALWGTIPLWALPAARPIILMLYLPPFSFGMLRFTRRQYFATVPILMGIYAAVLAAERVTGRPGFRLDRELFLFVVYGLLLTWFAFFGGFISALRRELGDKKRAAEKAHVELQGEMVERMRTQAENEKLIGELEASLAKVKRLGGLLPICAACKKIRDDKGYWNQIESYISMHSEVDFSHGICPDCAEGLYPGMTDPEPGRGPSNLR